MGKCFFIILFIVYPFGWIEAQQHYPAQRDSLSLADDLPDEAGIADGAVGVFASDTLLVSHPVFIEPDTIRNLKNKKEFGYIKNLDSLLKALQEKENQAAASRKAPPRRSFINEFLNAPLLKTILILLALFFVGVILYHLLRNQSIFKKAAVISPARVGEAEEDEQLENDYEKLIHQAFKLADYRMAVRYLFLQTLQQLKNKNLVEFARDKTNSRYAREIPQQLRNDFSRLVLAYEYAWYGNFAVSRDQFERIQKQFSSFNNKI